MSLKVSNEKATKTHNEDKEIPEVKKIENRIENLKHKKMRLEDKLETKKENLSTESNTGELLSRFKIFNLNIDIKDLNSRIEKIDAKILRANDEYRAAIRPPQNEREWLHLYGKYSTYTTRKFKEPPREFDAFKADLLEYPEQLSELYSIIQPHSTVETPPMGHAQPHHQATDQNIPRVVVNPRQASGFFASLFAGLSSFFRGLYTALST